MSADAPLATEVVYPESDGKPMADNTLQWDWMVKIVGELRELYASKEVFVAGDLFWYPVQGSPKIVTAPDALVVFGRPPGYRGSYRQWEEGGIPPRWCSRSCRRATRTPRWRRSSPFTTGTGWKNTT